MTDDAASPVAETVDTSAEAVERLAARMQRDGENEWRDVGIEFDPNENRRVHCANVLRALAAERDAMRQAVEVNASLRTEITMILRAKDAAVAERDDIYRRLNESEVHGTKLARAESRSALFLATALSRAAAAEARGLGADAVGRLVAVARQAENVVAAHSGIGRGYVNVGALSAALDALPPGILDQEPSEGR